MNRRGPDSGLKSQRGQLLKPKEDGPLVKLVGPSTLRLFDYLDQNSFFKTIAVTMEQMNNVTNLELISRLILNVNHIEAHRYMPWHASTWSIG